MNSSDFQIKIITKNGHGKFQTIRECHLPLKYQGEAYYTIANYRVEIKKHLAAGKTLSEYHGPTYHPFISFDLDRGKSSMALLATVLVEFIEYLRLEREIPTEYLRVYFSGAKGFHMEIPSKIFGIHPDYRLEVKISALVRRLISGLPITKYVDWNVYTSHRLIRLTNSINPKSGNYKIPITFEQLRTVYAK